MYEFTNKDILTEEDEEIGIISELLYYAEQNPRFNSKFVDAIFDTFEKTGKIHPNAYHSLVYIYKKFRVHEWREKLKMGEM
jgi:hypothetical protein